MGALGRQAGRQTDRQTERESESEANANKVEGKNVILKHNNSHWWLVLFLERRARASRCQSDSVHVLAAFLRPTSERNFLPASARKASRAGGLAEAARRRQWRPPFAKPQE